MPAAHRQMKYSRWIAFRGTPARWRPDWNVRTMREELLFRGLLLPRMKGAFGKYDWLANGVLFATYHLHQPWVIPTGLVDIFALAYPSRRFQSAWMGIIVHSTQSVFFIILVLTLVLK